ncbi:sodium-independent sulfate anion transporter isoform X2 [Chrysoperla carnea]|uniref:sodium-independent sulfate anion transporter isoform X2 n=1 Tax=Chrysoperla carnea TaxID=189513 RepID=UPI001D0847F4|nr:sodium-independent sulfate anion transporter isoform X2 [Chrysoperla carnea]
MRAGNHVNLNGGTGGCYTNPEYNGSNTNLNQEISGGLHVIENNDRRKSSTTSERLRAMVPWATQKAKSGLTKKMLYRRLPILTWLPKYNGQDAVGDLVAGITVGLTVIPQSLAYSNIAGLPPQYGLYGSFLGCMIYIIFGSCKDIPMGPTAIISLLTYQSIQGSVENAVLLCFLSGIVMVLMGVLGLGFIIDFVSGPVSSGFTSAVALIIITSQVKDILGITAKGSTFVQMWISISQDIHNTSMWDMLVGCTCIVILLILRLVANIQIQDTDDEGFPIGVIKTRTKIINKSLWLFGTSRNAILVIFCGFLGYFYTMAGDAPFKIIGYIPPGLPEFKVPIFSYETEGGTLMTLYDMCAQLGSGIIVIPLVALLEDISVCKAFANGKTIDATQELIAVGLSNLGNSFVQAFPGSGSLSRSAVINSSGVRTPLSGLYTGLLVIGALMFFTPYFSYIPKAALAAVIIAAVIFMVEVKVVKPMWRTKKSDLIPGLATFISCLIFPLEMGILVGVGVNIIFILYHAARPKITIENLVSRGGVEYLMLTPDRCLIFPSVDYVRHLVNKHSIKQACPVVIDCSHIYGADYTAAKVIELITQDFAVRDQPLFFYNLKPSVSSVFEGLSPSDFIVYYSEDELDELLKNKFFKAKDIFKV